MQARADQPEGSIVMQIRIFGLMVAAASLFTGQSLAELPAPPAAPGEALSRTLHAEGAQIYQCKPDSDGRLAWQFREPIATLLLEGKTVGRHYAGPRWEDADGSAVQAKVVGMSPGATPNDIPWLELSVTLHLGHGVFSGVTSVRRINTEGGTAQGPCRTADAFLSVPYHADYVFLR
jgi:hypothetical protein